MGKGGSTTRSSVQLGDQTELEKLLAGQNGIQKDYQNIRSLVSQGPDGTDVSNAVSSQRDLGSLLDSYANGGYLPSEADFNQANGQAQRAFAPQLEQLNQDFSQQSKQASRAAALQGRQSYDPVLRNQLAQQQTNQSRMLSAQQGAYANDVAMQSPLQRLQFANNAADIKANLASQAFANRSALLSLGQNLQKGERDWRFQTADKVQKETKQMGFGDYLTGAVGLAGAGFGIAGSLSGMANQKAQTGMYNAATQAITQGGQPQLPGTFMGAASPSLPGYAPQQSYAPAPQAAAYQSAFSRFNPNAGRLGGAGGFQ